MVTKRDNGKKEFVSVGSIIGKTGLKNIGGMIQEEYLTALKSWSKESKIYIEMRDDVTIGTLLDAIKLPLLGAEFDVEAGGIEEADDQAKDFLWDNMNQMYKQEWNSHVKDCLDALDFGFAIGEIVLEKREDGRMWLRNIDPRGQETLDKWTFGDNDELKEFVQRDPNTGGSYSIPISKCVHITFRGRKGNPQGRSLLRSLYRPWRFLKDLENLEAIGIERDVGGMPIAQLPEEPLTDDDRTKVEQALEALRVDEAMYLITPHGMEVSPYGGGTKMYDVKAVIDRYMKIILMRMFSQFLMLGMGQVGTQALVQGSQDFFTLGLLSVKRELESAWNQQLVPLLFKFNNFGIKDYPKIVWKDPGKIDIAAIMSAYAQGVSSQAITPVREDEEHFRTIMDLPELPEGEGIGVRIPEQPFMPEIWTINDKVKALSNQYREISNKIDIITETIKP